jgi:hypothetical protein
VLFSYIARASKQKMQDVWPCGPGASVNYISNVELQPKTQHGRVMPLKFYCIIQPKSSFESSSFIINAPCRASLIVNWSIIEGSGKIQGIAKWSGSTRLCRAAALYYKYVGHLIILCKCLLLAISSLSD